MPVRDKNGLTGFKNIDNPYVEVFDHYQMKRIHLTVPNIDGATKLAQMISLVLTDQYVAVVGSNHMTIDEYKNGESIRQ